MRSFKYFPTALSLFAASVSANPEPEPEKDVWVVVTQTNTITYCPITHWHTCDNTPTWSPPVVTTSSKPDGLTTTAPWTTTSTSSGTGTTSSTTTGTGSATTTTTTYSYPHGITTTTSTTGSSTTTSPASTTTTTYAGGPGWHYPQGYFFLSFTAPNGTQYLGFDDSDLSIPVDKQSQAASLTILGGLLVTGTPAEYVVLTSNAFGNQLQLSASQDGAVTIQVADNGTISIPGFPQFCCGNGKLYGGQTGPFNQTGPFGSGNCQSVVLGVVADPSHPITTTTTTTTTASSTMTTTSMITNPPIGFNGTNSTTTTTTTTTSLNSTSTCNNATHTATGLPDVCNSPGSRSTWCGGRSVSDDTSLFPGQAGQFPTGNFNGNGFGNPNTNFFGQVKRFDLVITNTTGAWDGVKNFDFAINGGTPGPLIELNWGDQAVITVHNQMQDNVTTIHWHGIRQHATNDQDGVPGITECGIAPGTSRTYTWIASTYGTGWYHAHALSQYGGGIRGPIIIHGPATADYDLDLGHIMIDDVYDAPMSSVAARAATFAGPPPIAINYLLNGKNKAPDGIHGENPKWIMKAGKKHLIRIINSSAQGSYIVHLDGHKFTVISADYTPIIPYVTENLHIQSGQRYNVIVEANQTPSAYFFRAITQAGCAVPNVNSGLGINNGIFEYESACGVKPSNAFANSTLPFNLKECEDEPLAKLKPFVVQDAGDATKFTSSVKTLPAGNAGVQFVKGFGPVVRWFFGGPGINATQRIQANFSMPTLQTLNNVGAPYNSSIYSNAVVLDGTFNDWVYFVIQNPFRTSHPIHLHGHDFSVLGQGKGFFDSSMVNQLDFTNPIRRDTALLYGTIANPSGWTVFGFKTDNPGAWLMHCHIIWHADGGMALQYIEHPDQIPADKYAGSDDFKQECSNLKSYLSQGSYRDLEPFSSGLKRRQHLHMHRDSHMMYNGHMDVVRHL